MGGFVAHCIFQDISDKPVNRAERQANKKRHSVQLYTKRNLMLKMI